jgi:hypothetical protein
MNKDSRLIAEAFAVSRGIAPAATTSVASTTSTTPAVTNPAVAPVQARQSAVAQDEQQSKPKQWWVTLPEQFITNNGQAKHAASMVTHLLLTVCKDKDILRFLMSEIRRNLKLHKAL